MLTVKIGSRFPAKAGFRVEWPSSPRPLRAAATEMKASDGIVGNTFDYNAVNIGGCSIRVKANKKGELRLPK